MKTKHTFQITCLFCALAVPAFTSGAQTVTRIAAGSGHTLFVKSDGSLWAMGDNSSGQLGIGSADIYNTNLPEQVVGGNVTEIAAGDSFSLFLKSDGSLWAMGYNGDGELGDGTYDPTNQPEQIVASEVTAVTAGSYHSLFLKSDGSLWTMGNNADGQLGDGTTDNGFYNTNWPERIVASNVTAIAGGSYFSLFLKSNGSLWAMGDNYFGQLGDGSYTQTNAPKLIVASNVTAIAAGNFHSLFLKSDGSLWVMGDNELGQLGDGATDNGFYNTNLPEQIVASNVTAIAAGAYHSLFLKSDGSLWAMGDNSLGQLGDGTHDQANLPKQIVPGNVAAITAGGNNSQFLKSDGSLWVMGDNGSGQLGIGTYDSTNVPIQIVAGALVPPGYNLISIDLLSDGNIRLSFVGLSSVNYALDRSFTLSPAAWIPQATNAAGTDGALVMTNAPGPTTANFWRFRSVP